MGVLCFVYLILALRTNLVFFLIFLCLVPAFALLTMAYLDFGKVYLAAAAKDTASELAALSSASKLITAAGALAFIVSMLGWWIFAAIMLAALDFPFQLPGKLLACRAVSEQISRQHTLTNVCLAVGDLSHIIKGASEKAK